MTRKGIFASVVVVVPVLLLSLVDLRSPSANASDRVRSQTDLERHIEGVRPFEGRWTGLGYSPFKEGAVKNKDLRRSPDFKRKIAEILRRDETTPESIQDRALISMISGDDDSAIRILEAGTGIYPRDASLYNDLAIAHLVKARVERDPYQLIPALSAIRRAVVHGGGMAEVTFNHALILGQLHLRQQSRRAWRQYLDLDADSGWAEEARAHLSALETPVIDPNIAVSAAVRARHLQEAEEIVRHSTQRIRFYVENEVLPGWARAVERSDLQSVEDSIRMAEALSALLLKVSGDRLLSDSVDVMREAQGEALKELSTAHLLYGEGSELFRQGDFKGAEERFRAAESNFARTESPFVLWATFNAEVCAYQQGRVDSAVDSVLRLKKRALAAEYLNLIGRIEWMVGLVQLERADPTAALVPLRGALRIFKRTGERGHEGTIASIIAVAWTYLGNPDEAWRYHFFAVSATSQSGDEAALSAAYGSLARSLLKKGQARAALVFQNEALTLEGIQTNPTRLSEAFWWRSMILHELGRSVLALRDLAHARAQCSTIPEPATRNRNMAGLLVTEGAIRSSLDPRESVAVLTRALDLYKSSKYSYLQVDIYLERARALRRLSLTEAAEEDLVEAIEEYEKQRAQVGSSRERVSYFSRAGDAFDEMVDLQIGDRHDVQRAFEFSERSRAREALDSAGCSGTAECTGRPLLLANILSRIPPRTTLIQYHLLDNSLLIWSLRQGRISSKQIIVDRHNLETLAERLLAAVQDPKSAELYLDYSRRLYQLLIKPVEKEVAASNRVVIVPDDVLEKLPFTGLLDSQKNRFLIEALPVAVEPSSSLYISAIQAANRRSRVSFASLAIGNPAFDRSIHPDLGNLPAAEREARALAARAPQSMLLTRKEATIARFLQEINRHDVIHFGGHALVDESVSGGSRLLFAASKGIPGDLFGGEIGRLRLTRPRLVTLSACNTGRGSYKGLEGVSDLARPFLAAGVPTVLISLWRVEDRQSEVFWKLFYDELFEGADAGTALRKAQLAMMQHDDSSLRAPRVWAGYRLIGSL